MELPSELAEQFARGNGTVFVGAGLSIGVGLASWADLINELAAELQISASGLSFQDIAQYYEIEYSRNRLLSKLRDLLDSFHLKPSVVHELIVKLPVHTIFTTNYDDLIEQALRAVGKNFDLVIRNVDTSFWSNDRVQVVKLHGDLSQRESIVLTAEDYEQYFDMHQSLTRLLAVALQTKTVLLIGYSATDPDFRQILTRIRTESGAAPRNVFAIQFEASPWVQKDLQRRGISVINIPLNQASDGKSTREQMNRALTDWLQKLNEQVQSRAKQQAHPPLALQSRVPLDELASEIAFWLDARGYAIQSWEDATDQTEELVAELPEGIRFLVRCVDGEIDLPRVLQFIEDLAREKYALGWLICDKRVAQSAREFVVGRADIQLFNLADFMSTIFGPYFDYLEERLQQTKIKEYYIDLACEKPFFNEQAEEIARDFYPNIDLYIDQWLNESGKNHISILGEFGAGKTWFCLHYTHYRLQRYLDDVTHQRIPLLVSLRDYARSGSLRQVITDLMVNRYKVKMTGSYEIFEKLNQNGRLLIIFDGFDEMASQVDHKITVANFEALAQTAIPSSKVLLTCRTPYFRTVMEERQVLAAKGRTEIVIDKPNFEILYLKELDEPQIEKVLRKRVPDRWEEYLQRIKDVYDLPNLAQRPVMLDMIITALPDLEGLGSINHSVLYQTYTNRWINKDVTEERTLLDAESKRLFAQEVAWEMFRKSELHIPFDRIRELVQQHLGSKLEFPEDIVFLEHDVRTASFISKRDESGNYEFMHRSFMEFFVAQKLAQAVALGDSQPLGEQAVYYEIIRFLNQMIDQPRDIPKMIAWWDDVSSNETLRANCIRISGQWIVADVLEKLISLATRQSDLSSLRRDAIRSIIRILHGEEADWTDRHVRQRIQAFAIRTSRNTLNVTCLPIEVKLIHNDFITGERALLRTKYISQVIDLLFSCLDEDEPEEISINASFALIHFASNEIVPRLLQTIQSHQNRFVRFNCCAALLALDYPGVSTLLGDLIQDSDDPRLVELGLANLDAMGNRAQDKN